MKSEIEKLIESFGGLSQFSRTLGHKNPTTIQGWKEKGKIPQWRIQEIVDAAKGNNISLPPFLRPKESQKFRVLISDSLSSEAVSIFDENKIDVDVKTNLSAEELKNIIHEYDALAIRSDTKVDSSLLESASRLKLVGRAGIGVDNVDIHAASQKGVIVMNTPLGNSITTAEHTIAMLLSMARKIPQANVSTHEGKWEKSAFVGVEVFEKKLGLIGVGNIGSLVAERALGLKMKVIAHDPFLSEVKAKEIGVEKLELNDLLAHADFISVHTPLTDGTRDLLNASCFSKCKKGVFVLNCARGGIINEKNLLDALNSGQVGGAALDVFVKEPAKENVLFNHPKVIVTPHLGASTVEAQEKVALQVAQQICDFLLNGTINNALNMPSLSGEESKRLQPYLKLGRNLGSFLGQMLEIKPIIENIHIEFSGSCTQLNQKPLVQMILVSVLQHFSSSVNLINAPTLAKERNIDISVTNHDRHEDYNNFIGITVKQRNDKRITVGGSIFGHASPRLTMLNDIAIEAELGPYMLYVSNNDIPGHIGALGSLLGTASVNIATFNLGRHLDTGKAIALLEMDKPIDENSYEKIQSISSVTEAKQLYFD